MEKENSGIDRWGESRALLDWHEVPYREWPEGRFVELMQKVSEGRRKIVFDKGRNRMLLVSQCVELQDYARPYFAEMAFGDDPKDAVNALAAQYPAIFDRAHIVEEERSPKTEYAKEESRVYPGLFETEITHRFTAVTIAAESA